MRQSTPIILAEILNDGGIGRDINDPITINDEQFTNMSMRLDEVLSDLRSDVTESNSNCLGLQTHLTEWECAVIGDYVKNSVYEFSSRDQSKWVTDRIIEGLLPPLKELEKKLDEALDHYPNEMGDIPF